MFYDGLRGSKTTTVHSKCKLFVGLKQHSTYKHTLFKCFGQRYATDMTHHSAPQRHAEVIHVMNDTHRMICRPFHNSLCWHRSVLNYQSRMRLIAMLTCDPVNTDALILCHVMILARYCKYRDHCQHDVQKTLVLRASRASTFADWLTSPQTPRSRCHALACANPQSVSQWHSLDCSPKSAHKHATADRVLTAGASRSTNNRCSFTLDICAYAQFTWLCQRAVTAIQRLQGTLSHTKAFQHNDPSANNA